jgi:tetratricopeptide (TPR) repeat protein
MTTFQELDAYLSQDFSDDYWADDASLYACDLVKQLTTDDWNVLHASWRNRSKQWQERCAEILDWGDARQALPLLLEMIQVEDDELTLTAADSLSSIGIADLDLAISADVLSRLQALANSGNVAKLIINQLQEQLQLKAYRDFLIELLQATLSSHADPKVVYPLLQANINKLDDNFAQVLRRWAIVSLEQAEPEQAQHIAENLGNFSNLIREFPIGNRATNVEIAITGYEVIARVFTRQGFPQDWAALQNNLGNAYLDRIWEERAENLEAAIRCYSAALEVFTRQAFPEQWAITKNNLGNAYGNRIWGERAENLEAAIDCFLAALEIFTHQIFPLHWADTQNNLGNAYLDRIWGERAENLEAAIRCYLAALEVFTRQVFPERWAMTQNNLGNAYGNRIWGERAENLEAAIDCFLAALEIFTREAFPQDHVQTQFNLGLAYQDAGQFSNAYNAYATAIDTLEVLGGEIVSGDEVKHKLVQVWNPLYQYMVEVCLELHHYARAIEYIERGQSRNLVELLANPQLYPEREIPVEIFNELERLRQEITFQPQLIHMEMKSQQRGILTWKSA